MPPAAQPIRLPDLKDLGLSEGPAYNVWENMTTNEISLATKQNFASSWAMLHRRLKDDKFDPTHPRDIKLLRSCYGYMTWLEGVKMTPKIRENGKVEEHVNHLLSSPDPGLPRDLKRRAYYLKQRWTEHNWSEATDLNSRLYAQLFGENGIMHGLEPHPSKEVDRMNYIVEDKAGQRTASVFGHNGLVVGQWFANRMAAFYHGAHGHTQAGIAGSSDSNDPGAYAVALGAYDDLNADDGDVIWYSGSQSRETKGVTPEWTNATKSLRASLVSRKPVRVLRGWRLRNEYAPSCGVRYDGLYRVDAMKEVTNKRGAPIIQFRLVRLPGQPPLAQICAESPTEDEKRAYNDLMRFEGKA